jgi:hypothetical protein
VSDSHAFDDAPLPPVPPPPPPKPLTEAELAGFFQLAVDKYIARGYHVVSWDALSAVLGRPWTMNWFVLLLGLLFGIVPGLAYLWWLARKGEERLAVSIDNLGHIHTRSLPDAPPDPAVQLRARTRMWWGISIAALGVVTCCCSWNFITSPGDILQPLSRATPPADMPRLGQPVTAYGYSLTATEVTDPARPGMLNPPSIGRRVIAVRVTVENVSDKAVKINLLGFKVADSNGNHYSASSAAITDSLAVADLNPGQKTEGRVGFSVPRDATIVSVIYMASAYKSQILQVGLAP